MSKRSQKLIARAILLSARWHAISRTYDYVNEYAPHHYARRIQRYSEELRSIWQRLTPAQMRRYAVRTNVSCGEVPYFRTPCAVCQSPTLGAVDPMPYCVKHERVYGHEWCFCWADTTGGCWRQAAIVSSAMAFCSRHGGADYAPRTTEKP